jgi:signal transduction histidine kinase
MTARHAKTVVASSVELNTALQLFLCNSLIFSVALVYKTPVLPLLCVCLLSFLLMLNIPYDLHLLEITLERLAQGLPVEPASSRFRWPLTRLFILTNMLGQQTGQHLQIQQSNLAYRDQLLQQVGKAAVQEERNRLARDLHDSIKQQIFSITVSAAAIKARWERDLGGVLKIVDDIERIALEAQVEMQALLQQLRPVALENVGLVESLRMQCQALGYRTGAEISVELSNLPTDELLPPGAQEMIFRIVQEGFANIARHARASHVWLSLRRQRDALLLEIGDDGQGFDLSQANERPDTYGGMGLSNVRERVRGLGGTVALWSQPGKGTTLHLCIPLVSPLIESQQQLTNQLSADAISKLHRILRGGLLAVELAVVFVLFYTPVTIALWALGICALFAISSFLWSHQYSSRLALEYGRKETQLLLLHSLRYGLLSGILLLCIVLLIYLVSSYFVLTSNILWLTFGLVGMLLITFFLTSVRCLQDMEGYYKTLSAQVLRQRLQQQLRQIAIDWLAWVIGVVLATFLLHAFPSIEQEQVVHDLGLVALAVWFVVVLLKSVHVAYWQYTLRRMTKSTLRDQKGGRV